MKHFIRVKYGNNSEDIEISERAARIVDESNHDDLEMALNEMISDWISNDEKFKKMYR